MYKIKDVLIEGFWGQHTIKTPFYEDVNIFIGINGTGKTTFIHILQAVLSIDMESISNLQFDKVVLRLTKGKSTRKIQVTKTSDLHEYKSLTYQISRTKYSFPLISREYGTTRYRTGLLHPQYYQDLEEVRYKLSALINISFLSVYREDLLDQDEFRERDRRKDVFMNPVDLKLMKLMSELTAYQLELEKRTGELSDQFQKNVLKTMLFNEEFDHVDITKRIDLDNEKINDIKTKLEQAYKDLEILDKKIIESIQKHVDQISNAAQAINKYVEDSSSSVYVNHVTPLTLLRRTRRIIELSSALEEKKEEIFRPIEKYLKLLGEYIKEKSFTTTKVGLNVKKANESFPISELSSGEKQLIILLTESLLQKMKPTVFFADEPEISLHISWQRKIIPSIMELNKNAQIIVATHSPEIVGKWKAKTINMENIIYG